MNIKITSVIEEQFPEWLNVMKRGFGKTPEIEKIKPLLKNQIEIDRIFAAVDSNSNQIIGTGGANSFLLTIPGGTAIPMAGVGYVATATTHRRQGVFSNMMNRIHKSAQERGDLVCGLWASQYQIYSRLDYGPSMNLHGWEIDPRFGKFSVSPSSVAQVEYVSIKEAEKFFPDIYEQMRLKTVGAVDRTNNSWQDRLKVDEKKTDGTPESFFIICNENNEKTGYAIFKVHRNIKSDMRMHRDSDSHLHSIEVEEAISITNNAHAALWRFILDFDLIRTVVAVNRPSDDPLYWMLADPRRLKRFTRDSLWIRLIDIKKSLESRTYRIDGKLKIGLISEKDADSNGTYILEIEDGKATVKKTKQNPDVIMGLRDLSALFLGGVRPMSLFYAGRLDINKNGSLNKLQSIFETDVSPWCANYF